MEEWRSQVPDHPDLKNAVWSRDPANNPACLCLFDHRLINYPPVSSSDLPWGASKRQSLKATSLFAEEPPKVFEQEGTIVQGSDLASDHTYFCSSGHAPGRGVNLAV